MSAAIAILALSIPSITLPVPVRVALIVVGILCSIIFVAVILMNNHARAAKPIKPMSLRVARTVPPGDDAGADLDAPVAPGPPAADAPAAIPLATSEEPEPSPALESPTSNGRAHRHLINRLLGTEPAVEPRIHEQEPPMPTRSNPTFSASDLDDDDAAPALDLSEYGDEPTATTSGTSAVGRLVTMISHLITQMKTAFADRRSTARRDRESDSHAADQFGDGTEESEIIAALRRAGHDIPMSPPIHEDVEPASAAHWGASTPPTMPPPAPAAPPTPVAERLDDANDVPHRQPQPELTLASAPRTMQMSAEEPETEAPVDITFEEPILGPTIHALHHPLTDDLETVEPVVSFDDDLAEPAAAIAGLASFAPTLDDVDAISSADAAGSAAPGVPTTTEAQAVATEPGDEIAPTSAKDLDVDALLAQLERDRQSGKIEAERERQRQAEEEAARSAQTAAIIESVTWTRMYLGPESPTMDEHERIRFAQVLGDMNDFKDAAQTLYHALREEPSYEVLVAVYRALTYHYNNDVLLDAHELFLEHDDPRMREIAATGIADLKRVPT